MIIFGWGTRPSVVETGRFHCPVCRTDAQFMRIRTRRWFSLFFVPVLPISDAQDSIFCEACCSTLPAQALPGQPVHAQQANPHAVHYPGQSPVQQSVQQAVASSRPVAQEFSWVALVGMLVGMMSFMSFCVFFISLPMALAAVIMGHMGLRTIAKNRPHMQGKWQAFVALATGYSAMTLSSLFLIFILSDLPRNTAQSSPVATAGPSDDEPFSMSSTTEDAFKAAEFEIASKRGGSPGRGNSEEAVALANTFAERLKLLSDQMFTSSKKPMLQLSGGEYLTYCELHDDRCLFLVHVPSYRKFDGDAKKALAKIAWTVAQSTVAGKLPPDSRLGVGLRGVLVYGDIMLGMCPDSADADYTEYKSGDKEDLYPFFRTIAKKKDNPAAALNALANDQHPSSSANGPDESAGVNPFAIAPPDLKDANAAMPAETPTTDLAANMAEPGPMTLPTGEPLMSGAPEEENPFKIEEPNANKAAAAWPPMDNVASNSTPSLPRGNKEPPRTSDLPRTSDRPRTKPTPKKEEFKNQIPIESIRLIKNDGWGFTGLAYSPDGNWLAATKIDESIIVFNARSGEVSHKLERQSQLNQVKALAFSAKSDFLVAGGGSGQVMYWKVREDGELTVPKELVHLGCKVEELKTSPKFPFFMAVTEKGTIAWQAFGANKSDPRMLGKFERDVQALWLPSEGTTAMATDGKTLLKFSLRDAEVEQTVKLDIKYAKLAAFSPDGQRLAITDFDNCILIEVDKPNRRRSVPLPKSQMVQSVTFAPDGRWVALGLRGSVGIVDFEKAQLVAHAQSDSVFYQSFVTFSPDGKILATASNTASDPIRMFSLP